jgi:hypothetical protein
MTVLCASDPYAVLGVKEAFSMLSPDLITGVATNTSAGISLINQLSDLPALNIRNKNTHDRLDALLHDRLGIDPETP